MISRQAITLNILEHSIPVLERPGYLPDMNPIEGVWNILKKDIGNQKLCKKKICGREYVKGGIV